MTPRERAEALFRVERSTCEPVYETWHVLDGTGRILDHAGSEGKARTDVPRLLAELARLRAVEAAATAYVAARDTLDADFNAATPDGSAFATHYMEREQKALNGLRGALRGGR